MVCDSQLVLRGVVIVCLLIDYFWYFGGVYFSFCIKFYDVFCQFFVFMGVGEYMFCKLLY